jgi:glycosyltransferase involved in cell wall biosynthesis
MPAQDNGETGKGRPKIVAAIPCYNEEQFIDDVVRRVSQHVDLVAAIDDGSSDQTADAARAAGALVVEHDTNQGYGAAIRSCFDVATAKGADVLVTIDGDGQHDPNEVLDVLEPLLSGEADMVIGTRFMGKSNNVPRYRKFGIDVITFLYNVGSSSWISDAQSGLRAYNREVLDAFELTETGMGVSVQTLIQARRKGYRIAEVPISCTYHSAGSTLNPVSHGVGVALTVIKLRLKSILSGNQP